MIQIIKEITQNKRRRRIAVLCFLCVSVAGLCFWFFTEESDPAFNENTPAVLASISRQQAPPASTVTAISAGDIVVASVFADNMDDVYGYQFDMHYYTDCLEYRNRLYSDIDEIPTIFATDKEQSLLVGATMIGGAKGYTGRKVPVCRVEFVALSDFDFEPDLGMKYINLSRVNVVKDDLEYLENVTGWTAKLSLQ